jgi:spore maturation protein SpmA
MILNYIWVGFFLIAFCIGVFKLIFLSDTEIFPNLVSITFDTAKAGFELSIGLVGVMTLWLGVMKIGEKAGIVNILTKVFGPFFKRLFPEIPTNHPAITPIFMKLSANLLGLDNAGTPLGIKAMKEMQSLNPKPDTASNAQIMFAVLNTTGLTFIPLQVIIYRNQLGAVNPADVFIPILLSTSITALSGMILVAIYQRINLLDGIFLIYLGFIALFLGVIIYSFSKLPKEKISEVSGVISNILLFSIIIFFIVLALFKRVKIYETFIEGAKEGFDVAVQLIPYLVSILVAVNVFKVSGAMQVILSGISYLFNEAEFVKTLPVAFMKPMSGSGATALALDTMREYGADSFAGRLSSIFQGTTDTTLYILAVYFGAVNIKKTRYATACGLLADLIGLTSAVFIAYIFFG